MPDNSISSESIPEKKDISFFKKLDIRITLNSPFRRGINPEIINLVRTEMKETKEKYLLNEKTYTQLRVSLSLQKLGVESLFAKLKSSEVAPYFSYRYAENAPWRVSRQGW